MSLIMNKLNVNSIFNLFIYYCFIQQCFELLRLATQRRMLED
jgi:hypothetical protein